MIEHPGSNPFIDSTAWKKYLGNKKKELMLLEEKERKLKNFRWLSAYRPTTKYDVFFAPISRTNLTELTP